MSAGTDASHADAWAYAQGRWMRAQYRAENADGTLFLLKSGGDKASSIRWYVSADVHFTRPVERSLKEPSAAVRTRLERVNARSEARPAPPDTPASEGEHPGHTGAAAP